MNFLIAPNAFKGTIAADDAATLIAGEINKRPGTNCLQQPVADGGDGTCQLLIDSLGLEKVPVRTLNAVGQGAMGYFGWDPVELKAYLDISTASGIGVLDKHQRDPYITSTFGTGLLIRAAVDYGAKEVILGLGGSATVDMGIGILSALGVLFLDENGREIPAFSPGYLRKIQHIQRSPQVPVIAFTLLCDVRNPFLGAEGAVPVFGPQKGLKEDQMHEFHKDCERVLDLLIRKSKRDWVDSPGFGAAGGVALGLSFFFPSEIRFGASYFFELVEMREKVLWSDWIVTGEGQYDSQSDQGKASYELLGLAKTLDKKTALITSGQGARDSGFDVVLELPSLDFSRVDFRERARENLKKVVSQAMAEGKLL
ncbi:glycerate kinase [Algoriphagus sp. H41]|uniref:Glycerate kinase n=1 Tax=Algoriphagus oliviformis TaxID=2811231 RepID=A0ABS3C7Z7_9BACT|nr:glycerate kinase [Algoriphagus oliviformis]MBN7813153.1 glycerate kinase [Algoriphagus oliviformis]